MLPLKTSLAANSKMMMKYIVTSVTFIGIFFLASCFTRERDLNSNHPSTATIAVFTATPDQTMYPSLATNMSFWTTATVSINATVSARGVSCPELHRLMYPEKIYTNSNENWTIYTCAFGIVNLEQEQASFRYDTFLLSKDKSRIWKISFENSIWGNGESSPLTTYQWTQDGKYLYLVQTGGIIGLGGGGGTYLPGYFRDNNALYRLNLYDGEIKSVLPYSEKEYAFSLSPNDTYLAYTEFGSTPVHLQNMNNESEKTFTLNNSYVLTGDFVWTPDSSNLIFASAMNGWEDGEGGISIYKVAIKDHHLENILLNDKRLLIPFPEYETNSYWSNENLLYVKSLNYLSYEYFSDPALDVQSGNVTVLATPEPDLIGSPTPKP
jgi:hypothetical protein